MKRIFLLFILAFGLQQSAFCQTKIPLMVNSADGTLIAISAGGTSNFFHANSNQLNQVIALLGYSTSGGGGGGYTPYFQTNNLNLILTNGASGSVLSNSVVITNGVSPVLYLYAGTGQSSQIITKIGNVQAWDIVQSGLGIQFQDSVSGNTSLALDNSDNTHVNYNLAVGGTISGLGSGLTNANGYAFADTNFVRTASNTLSINIQSVSNALAAASNTISTAFYKTNANLQVGSVALTNLAARVTVDTGGNISTPGGVTITGDLNTDNGAITTDGYGDMNLNGTFQIQGLTAGFQFDAPPSGNEFLIYGSDENGEEVGHAEQAIGPWNDLWAFMTGTAGNYAYGVIVNARGTIEAEGLYYNLTNVHTSTLMSNYDRNTLVNASSGNVLITLPAVDSNPADETQQTLTWGFIRDGFTSGPAYYSLDFYVWREDITANTVTICTSNHAPFLNLSGSPTNFTLPVNCGARMLCDGTNIYVEQFGTNWPINAANLTGTIPAPALTGANLGGATNYAATNIVFTWTTNALTTGALVNGTGGTGAGAAITNWNVDFATNPYDIWTSNSICISNVLHLTNGPNWVSIFFHNTNAGTTYYLSFAGNPTLSGGLTNGWPITNSLADFWLMGCIVGTNWQTNTAHWAIANPNY